MTIPPYTAFIGPVLKYLCRQATTTKAGDVHDAAAEMLGLSPADRSEELSSGVKTYKNRAGWALNTLKHGGLIESPTNGLWEVTAAGRTFASANPSLTAAQLRNLVAQARLPSVREPIAPHEISHPRGNRKAYRLPAQPLARGGQADIYEALRKSDQKTFVLKRVRGPSGAARMRREIEIQSALAHAHVMPILDWDEAFTWYVMPKGVRSMAEMSRPLEPALLCRIVRSVAAALECAHAAGHPHRDVKPHNVIELDEMNPGGARWVLADWGLTRRALGETTAPLTKSGALGTDGYAPPEAYTHAHQTGAAGDIYSLGQLIAWATGVDPVPNMPPLISQPWHLLVKEMTKLDQSERPQRISEVLLLLQVVEDALRGNVAQ